MENYHYYLLFVIMVYLWLLTCGKNDYYGQYWLIHNNNILAPDCPRSDKLQQ